MAPASPQSICSRTFPEYISMLFRSAVAQLQQVVKALNEWIMPNSRLIRHQIVSASSYLFFNVHAWHMSSYCEFTVDMIPKVVVRTGLSQQTLVACICCSCSTARRNRLFSPTSCSCRQAIQPVSGHPSSCPSPLAQENRRGVNTYLLLVGAIATHTSGLAGVVRVCARVARLLALS